MCYVSKENMGEAIYIMKDCLLGCENGIKYRPDHLKGFFTRNDIESFRTRVDEALRIYFEIVRVNSNYPETANSLSYEIEINGHPLSRVANILKAMADTPQKEYMA